MQSAQPIKMGINVKVMTPDELRQEREAYGSPEAAAKRLAEIKALIKVGLKVNVENGMHEILVAGTVCEVNDEGFKVEVRGRKTPSKWQNASFVKHGRGKPTLFDSEHGYTHVV